MSSSKQIHIVSFDVPYPADYGGVIDVYYRILALKKLGYKITLHCFEYGRGTSAHLEDLVEEVHYYSRKKSLIDWFSRTPFIVKTRASKSLLKNLLKDDAPILFEGLHCTYYLKDERLKDRIKLVRTHNIEHDYYSALAEKAEGRNKYYYRSEAKKLAAYESVLQLATHILAIQQADVAHFKQINPHVHLLPASIPPLEAVAYTTTHSYVLFHGNLSVPENENAARWLISQVHYPAEVPLKLAGKNPSQALDLLCKEQEVTLFANPDTATMDRLIKEAGIHVLYSEQATGLKLKLLHALLSAGHVIVNSTMVQGTDLAELCIVANSGEEVSNAIASAAVHPLTQEEFNARLTFLQNHYSTVKNCALFDRLINE